MHWNIKSIVILFNRWNFVHAQLTEFFEWCKETEARDVYDFAKYWASEMYTNQSYNAEIDAYFLCTVTLETLSEIELKLFIIFSDFVTFVENEISLCSISRLTFENIQTIIINAINDYNMKWSSFASFTIRKIYVLKKKRNKDYNVISASDLMILLRAHELNKFMSNLLCRLST